MKPRIIATSILLAFVAVSILFIVLKERRADAPPGGAENGDAAQVAQTPAADTGAGSGAQAPPASAGDEDTARARAPRESGGVRAPAPSDVVIVYYFHATRRCARCRLFEEYAREAIMNGFSDEIKEGTLAWRVVNVDEPANEHFVRDYSLATKSIVLVDMNRGREIRWKNLPRIWDLVGDKAAFIAYIQGEIGDFRKGA